MSIAAANRVLTGRKPLIGLTAYTETASWGVWQTTAALLPFDYVSAIAEAGAVPLLLPAVGGLEADDARAVVSALDAIVLSGGPDIDPGAYGAVPHPRTVDWRPDRDRWEIALVHAALDQGVPVLGICRGLQVLNVALGGSLRQHVPDDAGHEGHRPEPSVYGSVPARLDPDALPGRLLDGSIDVRCYHHQSIDRLGGGLTVTGRAADGTIEAVELAGHDFVCGVQWHPEVGRDLGLFRGLAAAASAGRGEHDAARSGERV